MSLGPRIKGWYAAGHRGTAKALAAALGEPLWDVRIALSGLFVKGEVALIDFAGKLNAPIFASTETPVVNDRPRPVQPERSGELRSGEGLAAPARRRQAAETEGRASQPGLFD